MQELSKRLIKALVSNLSSKDALTVRFATRAIYLMTHKVPEVFWLTKSEDLGTNLLNALSLVVGSDDAHTQRFAAWSLCWVIAKIPIPFWHSREHQVLAIDLLNVLIPVLKSKDNLVRTGIIGGLRRMPGRFPDIMWRRSKGHEKLRKELVEIGFSGVVWGCD